MEVNELYQRMHTLAAEKIGCECGNRDWLQFLYIEAGTKVIAGCKRCGKVYQYTEGIWIKA